MSRRRWGPVAQAVALAVALAAFGPAPATTQEPAPATTDPAVLFEAARALEADGEYELADALFDYILAEYPETDAAAAIRAARSRPDSRRVDSSGRTELRVWSTLYGLWLGVAVPGALGADAPEPYGLGLILGGPLGFLASSGATRNVSVGEGAAEAITWGGTWGTWQGFGWVHVLDIGANCETFNGFEYCSDPTGEAVFGSMIAGGVAGIVAGSVIARTYDVSPGRSTMASLGSLWGTWFGWAGSRIADVRDDDTDLAVTLLGGNLGLLVGALRPHQPLTRTRARLISVAGVAGALAGFGVDLLAQPSGRAVWAIPAATSIVGLVYGYNATRDRAGSGPAEAPGRGLSWTVGGPVYPTVLEGPDGRPAPAVAVTLLSARF